MMLFRLVRSENPCVAKARKIKYLFQHDTKDLSAFTQIKEDGQGLYVKGQLAMNTQKGKEVCELMKMGAIDGLSVGYRIDARAIIMMSAASGVCSKK